MRELYEKLKADGVIRNIGKFERDLKSNTIDFGGGLVFTQPSDTSELNAYQKRGIFSMIEYLLKAK